MANKKTVILTNLTGLTLIALVAALGIWLLTKAETPATNSAVKDLTRISHRDRQA